MPMPTTEELLATIKAALEPSSAPPSYRREALVCHAALSQRIRDLAGGRDRMGEYAGQLWDALSHLEKAEHDYRGVCQSQGSDHIETGKTWDRLRKCGDVARTVLDGTALAEED